MPSATFAYGVSKNDIYVMDKYEKRICRYSSALITLVVNSPKLLAMRPNGIIAHYWHFNLGELIFQVGMSFVFCYLFFYFNLKDTALVTVYRLQRRLTLHALLNTLFVLGVALAESALQRFLFGPPQNYGILLLASFVRLGLSSIFIGVLIKIILLTREGKTRELENERLKSANISAELELLKSQLNPHFLFNSLSSLSGVVKEDPDMAQHYIRQMSNIFRYAIGHKGAQLVTVKQELAQAQSFAELLKMRMEDAFCLTVSISEAHLNRKLPHLTLQPLLENVVKHNAATKVRPLNIELYSEGDQLIVANSLWEVPTPESSNGMGLVNLNERYRLLMNTNIDIEKTATYFIVKLPLSS